MENKQKSEKTTRIIYLVVVGVLVTVALVIGLVAAFGRDKVPTPDGEGQTPSTDEGENPNENQGNQTPDTDTSADGEDTPVSTYLAPAGGVVSKHHDLSLPVYSATMNDWRVHTGIDIATEEGADVLATAQGRVKNIWTDPLMGECISIDHGNGVISIYKNMAPTYAEGVAVDAKVTAGQKLGTVGNSAMIESGESAHLHFEMEYNGEGVDPLSYISEDSYKASLSSGDTAYES